ncbi:MAG TPA: indolepyruvate oxidoreductase subunit beta [Bacteroidales bacterium]|nr:indolepyruvate oxidoreductase subunit beta [Bacteroidales bacterium]HPS16523.1 indolepyruvate oxidoreductase subunit beta [Bacteroidales bacterium]
MKIDIVIAGVGGQGIVSIAATIGFAAVESGLFLKQSEVHGMSQRGGDVSSNLRLSDEEIFSDLIPKGTADMIIAVEPMESLRYLPMLSPKGWLITNTKPFVNIPNYPEIEKVISEIKKFPRNIAIDAEKIAEDLGSPKSANMVILGAASPFINMPFEKIENAVKAIFKNKGEEVVNVNLQCLRTGREFSQKKI